MADTKTIKVEAGMSLSDLVQIVATKAWVNMPESDVLIVRNEFTKVVETFSELRASFDETLKFVQNIGNLKSVPTIRKVKSDKVDPTKEVVQVDIKF